MRLVVFVATVALTAVLAGCKGQKDPPPRPPTPEVTVIQPVLVRVPDYWTYNGYLETTKAVEVRSKIRGFLKGVSFKEGTEVEVGMPLYKIDPLEFETALAKATAEEAKENAEIENWKAQIVQAKSDLARVTEAVQTGAESKNEQVRVQAIHDVAIARRDAAIAAHAAAKSARRTAEIQLGYTDIKAKIGGRISRTLVDEGNLVQADTTLLTTIVAVDKLYVYFDAPESDLIAYQKSLIAASQGDPMSLSIPVEVGVTKEDGYPHVGTIDFRENRVETSTGTIRIRGVIDNPVINGHRLLFPGLYAHVRVPRSEPVERLAIPEDCLISGQEGRFLYVLRSDNTVEKRLVTVGATVWKAPPAQPDVTPPKWVAVNANPKPPPPGESPKSSRKDVKSVVAITAGLNPGDRVILDGIQKTKPSKQELDKDGKPQPPKPSDLVQPEEWNLTPPAPAKK